MKPKDGKVVFINAIQLVNLPSIVLYFYQIEMRFPRKRASVAVVTDCGGFQRLASIANPEIHQLIVLSPFRTLCADADPQPLDSDFNIRPTIATGVAQRP